ncbi:MAG: hypothetical protein DMF75_20500, partial [Acidobacteria bacterium]
AQTLDHRLDDYFGCATTLQQTFAQFCDRTRFGRQQFRSALEDALAGFCWIDNRCFGLRSIFVRSSSSHRRAFVLEAAVYCLSLIFIAPTSCFFQSAPFDATANSIAN